MKIIVVILLLLLNVFAHDNYYYKNDKKVTIEVFSPQSRVNSNGLKYYKNQNGITIGISNKLIIKFKSLENIDIYKDRFDLLIVKKLSTYLYLLKTRDKNLTIDTANRLNEMDDIEFAHPDFVKKRRKR